MDPELRSATRAQGASGGPLFQLVSGTWYVRGVVSHGDESNIVTCNAAGQTWCAGRRYYMRNIWSPYLNDYVITLWNRYAVR